MNEQLIGDLFAEATRRMTGSSSKEFSQKFAELIVRECLVQVNEVYTSLDNKDKRVGAAAVGLTIAVHFGVEE